MNMSLGDVHKLSEKDVEKYYIRYQAVLGQQLTKGLVDSGIEAASKVASNFFLYMILKDFTALGGITSCLFVTLILSNMLSTPKQCFYMTIEHT